MVSNDVLETILEAEKVPAKKIDAVLEAYAAYATRLENSTAKIAVEFVQFSAKEKQIKIAVSCEATDHNWEQMKRMRGGDMILLQAQQDFERRGDVEDEDDEPQEELLPGEADTPEPEEAPRKPSDGITEAGVTVTLKKLRTIASRPYNPFTNFQVVATNLPDTITVVEIPDQGQSQGPGGPIELTVAQFDLIFSGE